MGSLAQKKRFLPFSKFMTTFEVKQILIFIEVGQGERLLIAIPSQDSEGSPGKLSLAGFYEFRRAVCFSQSKERKRMYTAHFETT